MEISKLILIPNSFLLIVVLAIALLREGCAEELKDDAEKIIGGSEVKKYHLHPYAAAIFVKYRNSYTCMGGVIHWSYVLTSCHCLTMNFETKPRPLNYRRTKEARFVVAGTHYIGAVFPTKKPLKVFWGLMPLPGFPENEKWNPGEQRREMREVFVHSRCRTKMGYPMDDIGVMRLNAPFTRRRQLSVGLLPVFSHVFWRAMSYFQNIFRSNGTCYSIGWGVISYTEPDEVVPDVSTKLTRYLKEAPMQVVDTGVCVKRMCADHFRDRCTNRFLRRMMEEEFVLFRTEICAYARNYPKDHGPCLGDSGHPFVCRAGDPKPNEYRGFLAGVSTTTMYCGMFGGGPNLFANIPNYYSFLNTFHLKFLGQAKNPWARPAPDCHELYPKLSECRRRSSSVRIEGCGLFLIFLILFHFL